MAVRQAGEVAATIARTAVIGIVRTGGAEQAVTLSRQIWQAGVSVVEVALTTPRGLQALETLREEVSGEQVLGAGTVLDAATARAAVLAGAEVLVTPTLVEDVIEVGRRSGIVTVIGCSTPTELLRATTLGADFVKVFPASLWSPAVLADVLAALPQLRCVPTGGVTPDTAADWIRAGAVAVGIGSALTKGDDPGERARALLAALRDARSGD